MAKRKPETAKPGGPEKGESVSGYFRTIFDESPGLLDTRSNDELLTRWLKDHPGDKEVPERVKKILSNVKSVLRSRGRHKERGRPKTAPVQAGTTTIGVEAPHAKVRSLASLEERIDDCLYYAKSHHRDDLDAVVRLLRDARNRVVWTMGQ